MYKVELTHSAERALAGVFRSDRSLYGRFLGAFDALARDPSQGKVLHGRLRGVFSYRLGCYRILYEIFHQRLVVVIIDLGHRKEIYE